MNGSSEPKASRREFVRRALAAAGGAAAALVTRPIRASAADGDVVRVSQAKTGTGTTEVSTSGTTASAFRGRATATTGNNYGMFGSSNSSEGRGVFGYAGAVSGATYGVLGEAVSTEGKGVNAYASAATGATYGLYALANSSGAVGAFGWASATKGMTSGVMGRANSPRGKGVNGTASSATGTNYGVYGTSASPNGYGVYGTNTGGGLALHADGNATVSGDLDVAGTLSKGGGAFKIDHPLDPANKYLYHSFVESPDMLNVYSGTATLDERGAATLDLPEWFEALNSDHRYQLTAIGASMPGLFISAEVADNRFSIAGGEPGGKVSWQVTGVRRDPFARDNRIPIEEDKPEDRRGTFLYPAGYRELATVG